SGPGLIFDAGSEVLPLNNIAYFVAPSGGAVAPGTMSLWQNVNGQNSEVVAGVEAMRLTFGGADPLDEVYQSSASITDWGRYSPVKAVRIELLLQSTEIDVLSEPQPIEFGGDDVDVSDGRMRQIFTATVAIRNRLN